MLAEHFYWLINMSVTASITGCAVLLVGKIRRIPRSILCLLWAIPFCRMWIPIGMPNRISLMSLLALLTDRPISVPDSYGRFTQMNFMAAADGYSPISYKTEKIACIVKAGAWIWLTVALLLLFFFILSYASTVRDLRTATHLRSNVYLSKSAEHPFVCGIFSPKIILPLPYAPEEENLILLHERMHVRRLDNLWRIIAIGAVCVHWFNPLSWIFLRSFLSCLELSCDEAVLRKCDVAQKKQYACLLLRTAEAASPCVSALGGAGLHLRIKHILTYQKLSLFSLLCLIFFAAVICFLLFTNAG